MPPAVDFLSISSGPPQHPLSDGLRGAAATLLQQAVAAGAALGWVDPPSYVEVSELLTAVAHDAAAGDAALVLALEQSELVGLGYWRRYQRPTHRPHADVEKVVVSSPARGRGVGRGLMAALIAAARAADVEVLTLDLRGDNSRAVDLYESIGFQRFGVLRRFVAVGSLRYDKVFYALDLRTSSDHGG